MLLDHRPSLGVWTQNYDTNYNINNNTNFLNNDRITSEHDKT